MLLDLTQVGGGNLTINSGVTLNLRSTGDGLIVGGTYSLFQNIEAGDIIGTFDTVLLDGAVNPDVVINYNDTNITVDLPTIIPEPSSIVLVGMSLLMYIRMYRKQRM